MRFSRNLSKYSLGHTLTGVWVEIYDVKYRNQNRYRHTLTGVWVEIVLISWYLACLESHPHGCVSWNVYDMTFEDDLEVTPSRVCELKYRALDIAMEDAESHPHGCVSWNYKDGVHFIWCESHPHGCVSWNAKKIESSNKSKVTPSRVCELKSVNHRLLKNMKKSHPHGCVSWNYNVLREMKGRGAVTPSRVCELKF